MSEQLWPVEADDLVLDGFDEEGEAATWLASEVALFGRSAEAFEQEGALDWIMGLGQGAATGAATGAAAGPWGAAIGALAGAGLGAVQTQQRLKHAKKQRPKGKPGKKTSKPPGARPASGRDAAIDQLLILLPQLIGAIAKSREGESESEDWNDWDESEYVDYELDDEAEAELWETEDLDDDWDEEEDEPEASMESDFEASLAIDAMEGGREGSEAYDADALEAEGWDHLDDEAIPETVARDDGWEA